MIKKTFIVISLLILMFVSLISFVSIQNSLTSKAFSSSVNEEVNAVLGKPIETNVEYGNIIGNGNKCATRIELLYNKEHLLDNWKQIKVDSIKWIYQPYKPISITYYDSARWISEFINTQKAGRYEKTVDFDDGQLLRRIVSNNDTNYGVINVIDLEDDEISTWDPRCQ